MWARGSSLLLTRVFSLVIQPAVPVSFRGKRWLSSFGTEMTKKSVCIVGSGNWGSTIAKVVGNNVKDSSQFETEVRMWMFEEKVNGRNLSEIFNTEHENVKYLPGVKLPTNVVAVPNLIEACRNADILVFVLPHQFISKTCQGIRGHVKEDAIAISLVKGFAWAGGGIQLVSENISKSLHNIPCAVMMGANLAKEVAMETFTETTIGCPKGSMGHLLKSLFETPYFRCKVVDDCRTVECCGALKNVVGIGAGLLDGMKYGENTKAAVLRIGLMEMIAFCEAFISDGSSRKETFLESCGVADLLATCRGGRNRMLGELIITSDLTVEKLEKEMLQGQSFQGPSVAKDVYEFLKKKDMLDKFPLFVAIHKICSREEDPHKLIDCLRDHYILSS